MSSNDAILIWSRDHSNVWLWAGAIAHKNVLRNNKVGEFMVSQVTEYLNITGSNQFDLAIEEVDESCCYVYLPWFKATLGLKSPWNFSYIWSALVNLSGWMYVWEVSWWMKERKNNIFVERHFSITMYCVYFSWGLHKRWCRHPSAGYIFRHHAIIFAVFNPNIWQALVWIITLIRMTRL